MKPIQIINKLNESEEINGRMKLIDVINKLYGGSIDIDVWDNDIDMCVAFCYDKDLQYSDEYSKFIDKLANNVDVVKQVNNKYGSELVCDFSSYLKPYNEEWKKFFNMDNSEFDEDEAYYEAVVNLEPLIAGNASESDYKQINDILDGKKLTEGEDFVIDDEDFKLYSQNRQRVEELRKEMFGDNFDPYKQSKEVEDLINTGIMGFKNFEEVLNDYEAGSDAYLDVIRQAQLDLAFKALKYKDSTEEKEYKFNKKELERLRKAHSLNVNKIEALHNKVKDYETKHGIINENITDGLPETDEVDPELVRVMNAIEDEMKNQDLHTYDIKSNDTDEMMFFIENAVKPIVNDSTLDDRLKKQIVSYMIMDVNDNARWSIKQGVRTIKDWYKVK